MRCCGIPYTIWDLSYVNWDNCGMQQGCAELQCGHETAGCPQRTSYLALCVWVIPLQSLACVSCMHHALCVITSTWIRGTFSTRHSHHVRAMNSRRRYCIKNADTTQHHLIRHQPKIQLQKRTPCCINQSLLSNKRRQGLYKHWHALLWHWTVQYKMPEWNGICLRCRKHGTKLRPAMRTVTIVDEKARYKVRENNCSPV